MFKNLVESGSHARDLKRRGGFMAASVIFYAVALAVAGVGSIYAYNARLDEREELEVLSLMAFVPRPAPAAEPAEQRRAEARPAAAASERQVAQVTEVVRVTPYATAPPKTNAPELPKGMDFVISNHNSVPTNVTNVGPTGPGGPGVPGVRTGPLVPGGDEIEAPPAKTQPKPEPPPRQDPPQIVSVPSSVLVGKTISKPVPLYPVIAKQTRVQGTVPVQILVDETGAVVSAQATGGPALLQQAAVQAARRARFTPTILTGRPVKVSGVILYNFILN